MSLRKEKKRGTNRSRNIFRGFVKRPLNICEGAENTSLTMLQIFFVCSAEARLIPYIDWTLDSNTATKLMIWINLRRCLKVE
jgi:hypothetical protein